MYTYKLGKTIENQKLEINFIILKLNDARETLKKYLKRRKEMEIQQNDT